MGTRGRKSRAELKTIVPLRHSSAYDRPATARETPPPPDHLQPATQAWWTSIVTDFELEQYQLHALQAAAEAWDLYQYGISHPRHQSTVDHRPFRVVWLHPPHKRRRGRPLQPRKCRDPRGRPARFTSGIGVGARPSPSVPRHNPARSVKMKQSRRPDLGFEAIPRVSVNARGVSFAPGATLQARRKA
jgi:hypothetical protein